MNRRRFIARPGRFTLISQGVRLLDLKLEKGTVELLAKTIHAARVQFATNEAGRLNMEDTADLIIAQLMLAIQENKEQ